MIREDFVSREIAELLKKKGFHEKVRYEYHHHFTTPSFHRHLKDFNGEEYEGLHSEWYSAPTIQMTIKWLRKVHHWHIFVIPRWEDAEHISGEREEKLIGYQYVIVPVGKVDRKNEQPIITAPTPESAYEEGIKYCIENLI